MKPFKSRDHGEKTLLQKSRLFFLIILVLFLAVAFLGIRSLRSFQTLQNPEDWARSLREKPRSEGTNYLLYGFLEKEDETLVDEIFFLNFNDSSASPHIIFIPGNALLLLLDSEAGEEPAPEGEEPAPEGEEPAEKSLTSYYTPGNFYDLGGAEMLITQISSFLGVPIHHYIGVQYEGIPVLVDDRGGISYRGHVLKGEDYLDYFLQGESGEDYLGRALRRARAIESLVDFAAEKRGLFATPRLLKAVSPYLDTDLSWNELQEFYPLLAPLFDAQTLVVELPGVEREINGETFFEPDQRLVAFLMENLGEDFILPRDMISVEILNGCGVQGIAGQLGEMLRGEGFSIDNDHIGNADHFDYERTQVISRLDDMGAAKQVAGVVGVAELIKEPIPDYPVMVTIIIGKDFSL